MPKKLSINVRDGALTNIRDGALAAGFFSQDTIIKAEKKQLKKTDEAHSKKEISLSEKNEGRSTPKNKGGHPRKEGLKAQQFSLTLPPDKYEKLKLIAEKYTNGNISNLIDIAVTQLCDNNNIDLDAIQVDPEILEKYREKQNKRKRV